MLTKKLYEQATGRSQKSNVIAYQIRQSFRPGEITAEEANQVGYELASRFLKGKHAFIVATHTDREHIHNHIIFNSTALDGTRKFRDFFFSGLAVQRLSDLICLEHQLSVIEKKPYRERQKRITYPPRESNRDDCAVSSTKFCSRSPPTTKIFCKIWNSRAMRSSVESTPPSKAKGKSVLFGFVHWAKGIAKKKSKLCWLARQSTTPARNSRPKNSPFNCWWTFKQNLLRVKAVDTSAGRKSTI